MRRLRRMLKLAALGLAMVSVVMVAPIALFMAILNLLTNVSPQTNADIRDFLVFVAAWGFIGGALYGGVTSDSDV